MKIDHIVLMVSDLKKSQDFFSSLFGEPASKYDDYVSYQIGEMSLFIAKPENNNGPKFDKGNIGLNHLAWGVRSLNELKDYESKLTQAGITHSGVQIDKYGKKEFIWFDDPDGMRLEFYLRKK